MIPGISSLQASLILVAALAVCRLARHRSAAWRSAILTAAIAAAAAIPLFTAAAPRLGLTFRLPEIPAQWLWVAPPDPAFTPAADAPSSGAGSVAIEQIGASAKTPGHSPGLDPSPWPYLRGLWLAGVAFGMLRIVYGMFRLKRIERASEPVRTVAVETIAAQTHERYGLRRPVAILVKRGEAPVTWGLFRPKLLLPAQALEWTERRLRIVVAHEFAHVRRGDWAFQIFAEIQRAIFWFNPIWWIVVRRLVEESERAADDFAMTTGIDTVDGIDTMGYAEELLALARTYSGPKANSAAIAMARSSVIERRFDAIVNPRNRRGAVTRRTVTGMSGAFAVLMLVLAACQPAASGSVYPPTLLVARVLPGPEPVAPLQAPAVSQAPVAPPSPAPAAVPSITSARPPTVSTALKVLSGRVGFDDGDTLPVGALPKFQVILASDGGRRVTQPYTNTQGMFTYRIAPGEYSVMLTPLRLGFCLKSATYGTTDLTRGPLVLRPDADDTQINVVVTKTCPAATPGSRVSGRVKNWPPPRVNVMRTSAGRPVGRGSPNLRPTFSLAATMADRPGEFFDIYNITPKANGAFDIEGVPSGHYAITSSLSPNVPLVVFDVAERDLADIEFSVGPDMSLGTAITPAAKQTIRGVVDPGDGAVPQFRIQFTAVQLGTSETVTVSGREFSVSLSEGQYRVTTSNLPPGYTMRSATAGPLDATEAFLVTGKGIADRFTGIPVRSGSGITIKLERTPR